MSQPIYRQGDVLLVKTTAELSGFRQQTRDARSRIVLAEGEATGHAHVITHRGAELYEGQLEARFLKVLADGGIELVHEEHATITIPPGTYRVVRQREYLPEGERWVAD